MCVNVCVWECLSVCLRRCETVSFCVSSLCLSGVCEFVRVFGRGCVCVQKCVPLCPCACVSDGAFQGKAENAKVHEKLARRQHPARSQNVSPVFVRKHIFLISARPACWL